jgi:hypothetical protein
MRHVSLLTKIINQSRKKIIEWGSLQRKEGLKGTLKMGR